VNGNLTVDGKEVWAQAEKGNGKVWLRIVEKTAMVQAHRGRCSRALE